ncbi:hypothetical protein [Mesorhizobium sp. CAU 1732]|uniref:hypothetical protein n=1 Tax=Mesorhizobium sp. CAU 1732 TaxID=3140358 RepID=UPI003260BF5E
MSDADWKPTMQAASALDAERFTMCWGELEYDDPFTAIISYDGSFSQPWRRTDVQREIVDVAYLEVAGQDRAAPTALSNEGDVYVLLEGGTVDRSKIDGAGVLSEDATGLGAVHSLAVDGTKQSVVGESRQLYERDGLRPWRRLSGDKAKRNGYEAEHFGEVIALADGDLMITGFERPYSKPGAAGLSAGEWENVTPEDFMRMMKQQREETSTRTRIQKLHRYSGGELTDLSVPEDISIQNLYLDPKGRVWLTGHAGLIMRGTPQGDFEKMGFHGDDETLFSSAWFAGELIVAADNGPRRFDGHMLTPMKPLLDPSINPNVPVPLKVQAVADVLYYFDAKHGVQIRDGSGWRGIQIPHELLEREFKGFDL